MRTPPEDLDQIRSVFKPRLTDLANALGVSREALDDWQAGKPLASEHASRLADLADAADVFAVVGLVPSSKTFRRAIRDGKNFFDLVRDGDSAVDAARALVDILRVELRQREALKSRLGGRTRPTREAFDEIGVPMLDERISAE